MEQEYDFLELATEYADLVIASEHGVDRFGDEAQSDYKREIEIEKICKAHNDQHLLQQAVNNYLEELSL